MEYILTADEMKKCDEYTIGHFHLPPSVLMERAALKCVASIMHDKFNLKRVLVVCGSGNNGGDGLAIARILHERKINVDVLLAGSPVHMSQESRENYESCVSYGIPMRSSVKDDEYTLIVDAIFGIGLNRKLERDTIAFIDGINSFKENGAKIVSVDIPSGVNASTGEIMGAAIKADMTVTFAYYKKGLLLYPGIECVGKLVLANIGITDESFADKKPSLKCITKKDFVGNKLLKRPDDSNKGTFGKALIIAGSENMGGCALLAALSCFKTGAGMVRVFTHKDNKRIINLRLPEAIVDTYDDKIDRNKLAEAVKWADVTAIGPGIGKDGRAKELFEFAFFKSNGTLILDADALYILKRYKQTLRNEPGRDIIITPHLAEFAAFMDREKTEVKRDLVGQTMAVARNYHLTCVTKDSRTVISNKEGECFINTTGNNGMAVAGTGDCLFGIIAGLSARGLSPLLAAAYGCYMHGYAGDIAAAKKGKSGMLASNLIESLKLCLEATDEQ
ncbi:MAG: NAD(P)H-hydrate dehydratase [Lachnospiraceae bacterium]|nr:NAD(P)H-hydrate dehydratase [Lachnospiraceae bacterium]